MRRAFVRGAFTGISLLFALLLEETDARAQQCSSPYLSTCINSDTYWPHAGPQRFAAVGSAETVADRQIAFGLVTTYLSRPIIINGPSPGGAGTDQFAVDNQVNANFLFAYGITDRLQLDIGVPITLVQTGAGTSPLTAGRAIRDTSVRDMRFGFAYALVPRRRIDPWKAADEGGPGKGFALVSRLTMSAPVGDNADFAGERSLVFGPSLAADYRVWRMFFGADLGARLRPVTEFAGARVGSQITSALGAGFDILPRDALSVLLEGRAYVNLPEQHTTQQSAFGISSRPNGDVIVPAEWMLGLRSAPLLGGDISFFGGGGGPIPISASPITVPRFRFVLGITYAPIQRDTDDDGVPDRIDRCPTQAGERGGERPGCPLEATPPAVPAAPPPPRPNAKPMERHPIDTELPPNLGPAPSSTTPAAQEPPTSSSPREGAERKVETRP
ncbi:MAG TPA: hypothetical protein VM925_15680 [Labilithrix sp.]|nr:hypothetical protein [Labilithrix sp.]